GTRASRDRDGSCRFPPGRHRRPRAAGRPRRGPRDRRGVGPGHHRRPGAGRGQRPRRARRRRRPLHDRQRAGRPADDPGPADRLHAQDGHRRAGRRRADRRAEHHPHARHRAPRRRDRGGVGRARLAEQRARPAAHRHRRGERGHLRADPAQPRRRRRAGGAAGERGERAGRQVRVRARPRRALHDRVAQRHAPPEPRARAQGGAARPVPVGAPAVGHDLEDVHARPAGRLQRRAGGHPHARVPRAAPGHLLGRGGSQRPRDRRQRPERAGGRRRGVRARRRRSRPARQRARRGEPLADGRRAADQPAHQRLPRRVAGARAVGAAERLVRAVRRRQRSGARPARRLPGVGHLLVLAGSARRGGAGAGGQSVGEHHRAAQPVRGKHGPQQHPVGRPLQPEHPARHAYPPGVQQHLQPHRRQRGAHGARLPRGRRAPGAGAAAGLRGALGVLVAVRGRARPHPAEDRLGRDRLGRDARPAGPRGVRAGDRPRRVQRRAAALVPGAGPGRGAHLLRPRRVQLRRARQLPARLRARRAVADAQGGRPGALHRAGRRHARVRHRGELHHRRGARAARGAAVRRRAHRRQREPAQPPPARAGRPLHRGGPAERRVRDGRLRAHEPAARRRRRAARGVAGDRPLPLDARRPVAQQPRVHRRAAVAGGELQGHREPEPPALDLAHPGAPRAARARGRDVPRRDRGAEHPRQPRPRAHADRQRRRAVRVVPEPRRGAELRRVREAVRQPDRTHVQPDEHRGERDHVRERGRGHELRGRARGAQEPPRGGAGARAAHRLRQPHGAHERRDAGRGAPGLVERQPAARRAGALRGERRAHLRVGDGRDQRDPAVQPRRRADQRRGRGKHRGRDRAPARRARPVAPVPGVPRDLGPARREEPARRALRDPAGAGDARGLPRGPVARARALLAAV
ncbi:MAG: TonB-dependent receptor, partial [uncultured Gemmatimonadaceae bacterium]